MATLKIAKDLFDLLYPIGTYYETSNTNWTPSRAGWYGTWVEDTAGKTTVAKDNRTFKTLGASVGSESVATGNHTLRLSEIPSHCHGSNGGTSISGGEHSNHTARFKEHYIPKSGYRSGSSDFARKNSATYDTTGTVTIGGGSHSHTLTNQGGGGAHNHGNVTVIQPSVVVRRWHRTA